ncbi:MAG TPA: hypothetical protein VK279_06580 [Solirubrobacteraceae bacterium]|nr:hypothetical protein [Solirubrobacteraceae bacterium]
MDAGGAADRVLFPRAHLDGIAAGEVTLAFRRWPRPRVRPGSRLRTRVGVLAVDAVDVVDPRALTDVDARKAGFASRLDLLATLERRGPGAGHAVHRVVLRLEGPDPRVALREDTALDDDALRALAARLDRLDRASRHGPWTRAVLDQIAAHPATRAPELATAHGRETAPFKRDVRKLKELGLTESLPVGYRLSPRGRALLRRLDERPPGAYPQGLRRPAGTPKGVRHADRSQRP